MTEAKATRLASRSETGRLIPPDSANDGRVHFVCPVRWNDAAWLVGRAVFCRFFEMTDDAVLHLNELEWLDLQPMNDLLLHLVDTCARGRSMTVELPDDGSSRNCLRTLRFLAETGFFEALRRPECDAALRFRRNGALKTSAEVIAELEILSGSLPPRRLNFAVLLPCQVVDAGIFRTRESIFHFCRQLKTDHLQKLRPLELTGDLVYHIKIFLDSVLPELLDNVRIHKPKGQQFIALFGRIRMREERLSDDEPVEVQETQSLIPELNKHTQHLWQYDTVEIAVADLGPGIQESWIDGWKRNHPRAVPRLPNGGPKVNGKNGDSLILFGVFLQPNMSSMTPAERMQHDLRTNLTGLHSLRHSIDFQDWHFSVRSGSNYVVLSSQPEDDEENAQGPRRKLWSRVERSDGVQYLFRFAAHQFRGFNDWTSVIPAGGISENANWWTPRKPPSNIAVSQTYVVPSNVVAGTVVLCRPAHCLAKGLLLQFLNEIQDRDLRLIFCDVPVPIALRLFLLIQDLTVSDKLDIVVPILSNTWFAKVAGVLDQSMASTLVGPGQRVTRAWWTDKRQPVRTSTDIAAACRHVDSIRFWQLLRTDKVAILDEPVKWSDGLILVGGYLSFATALTNRGIWKLVRRNLVSTAHALRVSRLRASSESVKRLVGEANRYLSDVQGGTGRDGIVGSVRITGATMEGAKTDARDGVDLPVFDYPRNLIANQEGPDSVQTPLHRSRVLDWFQEADGIAGRWREAARPKAGYSRVGRSGRIRLTPDNDLIVNAEQKPKEAYDVWQRQEMIRVGHFSGSYYHHFLWLDLVSFLNDKTPDSNHLIQEFAETITKFSPYAMFYEPNEASALLLDRLRKYAGEAFPKNVWPVGVVLDYSHLPTANVGGLASEVRAAGTKKAIFLDSICVSGRLAARVHAHLTALDYSEILDLVILDRTHDVDLSLPHKRISWWSLSAPRLGSPRSCRLCAGIRVLAGLATRNEFASISSIFEGWANSWRVDGSRDGRFPVINDAPLATGVERRLGGELVKLFTRNALLSWTVELIARLSHFSYICERQDRPDEAVRTLVTAAICLQYWNDLHSSHQRQIYRFGIEQLWAEGDNRSRTLLIVALCSLESEEIGRYVSVIEKQIIDVGIPSLDVGLAAYAVLHLGYKTKEERVGKLLKLRRLLRASPRSSEEPWRRALELLTLWLVSTGAELRFRSVMRIIGVPGRGAEHDYVFDLLDKIERETWSGLGSAIAESLTLLDPVKSLINEQRELLQSDQVEAEVIEAMTAYEKLGRRYREPLPPSSLKVLKAAAGSVRRVLSIETVGGPSVRQILSARYIHYVPFIVRRVIADIVAGHPDYKAQHWNVDPLPLETEQLLLRAPRTRGTDALALEDLQEQDVVCVPRDQLEPMIRDLLLDMKHALRNQLKIAGQAYMKVSCGSAKDDAGRAVARIDFVNQATPRDGAVAGQAKSLSLARYFAADIGGSVEHTYFEGIVTRRVTIPMFALKKPQTRKDVNK